MKRLSLQPEQLIVPGDEGIGNESVLPIYFRIFEMDKEDCIPPVIAIHKNTRVPYYHGSKLSESYNNNLSRYLQKNSQVNYFMLDGNHKALAAALNHKPISVLELTKDSDIAKCIEMCERGELFNWNIQGNTLDEITYWLGRFFVGRVYSCESFFTVSDKVERLVEERELPQYMIDRYLQKS